MINKNLNIQMIEFISNKLLGLNYSVLANYIDWEYGLPPQILNYTPDIFAYNEFEKNIYIVETRSTIYSIDTFHKLKKLNDLELNNFNIYLVLPLTIGMNEHTNFAIDLIRKYKLKNINLLNCDLRREKIFFFNK